MTDRERIDRTYAKVKKKYPDVTSKEEIDTLAIKHERRFSLLCCLGLAAGAILCFVLAVVFKSWAEPRYVLFVTGAFQIIEIFRTLSKYSKIEKMFKPVETVEHQGTLTEERILQDGGKVLKKADHRFVIAKLPLFDKEDETEVGLDNMTSHSYRLYFKIDQYGRTAFLKTSKNTYMNAAIGAMYYVVLTQQNEIAEAYQASNWDLGADVLPLVRQAGDAEKIEEQTAYQPAPIVQAEKIKTKKLLPILAMVLMALSFFTIILIGVPMGIAALIIAIVALVQQRSKLSVASMVITAMLFVLMILSVIAVAMA